MSESSLDSIARRLDALESYAAIQQLVADYGNAFDHEDKERLARIWSEDAVLDVGEFGRYEGRDAILAAVATLSEGVPEQHHWHANHSIDLDGDTATGLVALDCAVTAAEGGPHMVGGFYEDRYELRDGEWKIVSRVFTMEYWSPIRGPLRQGVTNTSLDQAPASS
jgi:uncharacterized protein (TIGR02246 family)